MLETLQVTHRKLGFLKILAILFLFLLKFVKFPSKTVKISAIFLYFSGYFSLQKRVYLRDSPQPSIQICYPIDYIKAFLSESFFFTAIPC